MTNEKQRLKVVELADVPLRDLHGKYCLLPYIRMFAECDNFSDEMIVHVLDGHTANTVSSKEG